MKTVAPISFSLSQTNGDKIFIYKIEWWNSMIPKVLLALIIEALLL